MQGNRQGEGEGRRAKEVRWFADELFGRAGSDESFYTIAADKAQVSETG